MACTTEMSTSSEDSPSDDVLSKIFKILDVSGLLSCTKVCRKWKCVIESLVLGIPEVLSANEEIISCVAKSLAQIGNGRNKSES